MFYAICETLQVRFRLLPQLCPRRAVGLKDKVGGNQGLINADLAQLAKRYFGEAGKSPGNDRFRSAFHLTYEHIWYNPLGTVAGPGGELQVMTLPANNSRSTLQAE